MVVNAARPGRVQSPDDESEGRGVEKRRSSASAAVRRPAVKWRRGNVKGAWGGQGRAGKGEVRAQDGKSVAIAYGQGKKPEIASFAIRLQFSPFPRHFRYGFVGGLAYLTLRRPSPSQLDLALIFVACVLLRPFILLSPCLSLPARSLLYCGYSPRPSFAPFTSPLLPTDGFYFLLWFIIYPRDLRSACRLKTEK